MCNRYFHYFYGRGSILMGMLLFCYVFLAQAQNTTESSAIASQPTVSSVSLDELLARYPAGSIHTIEDANRAGDDVHKMHALIEAQFSDEQKLCFPKFFATSCLIAAKERHRVALAKVRVIEIEVNKFKRLANVQARDKAQAAKQEHEAAELASHEKEGRSPTSDNVSVSSQASPTLPAKTKSGTNSRIVKHQTEVNKRQAAEIENAKQRASNIAAYEKKQKEAEARQQEIAAKKAEKARSLSSKAASESK